MQEAVHAHAVPFRIREEKISMPKVQEHKSKAADYLISDHHEEKKLARIVPRSVTDLR